MPLLNKIFQTTNVAQHIRSSFLLVYEVIYQFNESITFAHRNAAKFYLLYMYDVFV